MSLILCPQEGCGRWISPTASICPGCGFNTQQYFREDLRGFQNHDSMLKFAHWVDNGDGTITDTKNSLTWIRAPYGIKWHDGARNYLRLLRFASITFHCKVSFRLQDGGSYCDR